MQDGINRPVYPSVAFPFESAKAPSSAFGGNLPPGTHLYPRFGHPNFEDLVACLAKIEGGESAALFASGIAATFALFWDKCDIGDHIVVSSRIYGGTRGQLQMITDKMKLRVSVVDITDHVAVCEACTDETKLLFVETVSNPELVVADLSALSVICRSGGRKICFIVDNTFSPLCARPLLHGADVVMHSLTKYVDGESDAMGGALIGSKEFIDGMTHPRDGVASLTGAVIHYEVAQRMANRVNYLEHRVRESGRRAFALARLFERAGLRVHYPLLSKRPNEVLEHAREEMGGGVFSVAFESENTAALFVDRAIKMDVSEPLIPNAKLAYSCVSLGSAHTYVWVTIEANAQSKAKWTPLPFSPIPPGFVRFAVGYAGDFDLCLKTFERLLCELGWRIRPGPVIEHT